jgi:riboflavin kinase/FMN adenylyltransferase
MRQSHEKLFPIFLTGKVVHGKALGRTVGMPTANIEVADKHLLPECGVYATCVLVEGKKYLAVTNIGLRPTVDQEQQVTVEAHILDFDQDIYGQSVELEVHKFLRPIRKFTSLEEVQKQVEKDIEEAKQYLQ